jgi:P4 family phage/plasmid primase-like protien
MTNTDPDFQKVIKQDKAYSYAFNIKEGKANGKYLYCLEDDKFYHYKQGYWEMLYEKDFLGKIQESMPEITKFALSRRKQITDNYKILGRKHLNSFNWSNLINLKNTMINPLTGVPIDHDPSFYSTIRLPYTYDENAKCQLWEETLLEIFEFDLLKIHSLQEYFGYCLTKETNQIMSLLLLGESKSGKSTLTHVLRHMVGLENSSSVSMENISNAQYTPLLINKLINIDSDVSENSKNFEAQFKIITSGEPINCNQKFVPTFEFLPYCKIIMAANAFPRITDHTSAFYNRLLIIPCDRVFLPEQQDRTLKVRLLEELPGILLWSMQGLKNLNQRGRFEEKDFMRDAIEELRDESNPIDVFFRDHIEAELKQGFQVEKNELYKKYEDWCIRNGNRPLSSIKFGKSVYQKYSKFSEKNSQCFSTGKRIWRNLRYVDFREIIKKESINWQDIEAKV